MRKDVHLNSQSKDVQDKLDEITLDLLASYHKAIKKRLDAGDLEDVKLTALTKEFRSLALAIKKPAMNLTLLKAPEQPQIPEPSSFERRDRLNAIEAAATDPEAATRALESQDRLIDRLENERQ